MHNNSKVLYKVVRSPHHGYGYHYNRTRLLYTDIVIKHSPHGVATVAMAILDRTNVMNEALEHAVKEMFSTLHKLLKDSQLYSV